MGNSLQTIVANEESMLYQAGSSLGNTEIILSSINFDSLDISLFNDKPVVVGHDSEIAIGTLRDVFITEENGEKSLRGTISFFDENNACKYAGFGVSMEYKPFVDKNTHLQNVKDVLRLAIVENPRCKKCKIENSICGDCHIVKNEEDKVKETLVDSTDVVVDPEDTENSDISGLKKRMLDLEQRVEALSSPKENEETVKNSADEYLLDWVPFNNTLEYVFGTRIDTMQSEVNRQKDLIKLLSSHLSNNPLQKKMYSTVVKNSAPTLQELVQGVLLLKEHKVALIEETKQKSLDKIVKNSEDKESVFDMNAGAKEFYARHKV